ncbi:MAG: polymorphic toxin-type HINT domain-containing protein [Clostridia bacterium]|nr:polymorphic toxin-type HINT domain-containing protein [Clostridia bacterium]
MGKKFIKIISLILIFIFVSPYIVNGLVFAGSDNNDTFTTATMITDFSNEVTAGIDNPGDVDYYKFTPKVSGEFKIESTGSTDVCAYLYQGGVQKDFNDDGVVDTNFTIMSVLSAGKEYYLKIFHYNSSKTGAYNLKITAPAQIEIDIKGYNSKTLYVCNELTDTFSVVLKNSSINTDRNYLVEVQCTSDKVEWYTKGTFNVMINKGYTEKNANIPIKKFSNDTQALYTRVVVYDPATYTELACKEKLTTDIVYPALIKSMNYATAKINVYEGAKLNVGFANSLDMSKYAVEVSCKTTTGAWLRKYYGNINAINMPIPMVFSNINEAGVIYTKASIYEKTSGKKVYERVKESTDVLRQPLPDLKISNVTWAPSEPNENDYIKFSATVTNIGKGASPNGVIHGVRFYVDGKLVAWNDGYKSSIAPGKSVVITANDTIDGPEWIAGPTGTLRVYATIDALGKIDEAKDVDGEEKENNRSAVDSMYVNSVYTVLYKWSTGEFAVCTTTGELTEKHSNGFENYTCPSDSIIFYRGRCFEVVKDTTENRFTYYSDGWGRDPLNPGKTNSGWVLKYGGSNNTDDVIVLQKMLVTNKYLELPENRTFGYYDELTKLAVMEFQAKRGLPADGEVGPRTWREGLFLPWDSTKKQPDRSSSAYKNILNNDVVPPPTGYVEVEECITGALKYSHLKGCIEYVGDRTINITRTIMGWNGGPVEGDTYSIAVTLPMKRYYGKYYAKPDDVYNAIKRYVLEKSSRGIYLKEYKQGYQGKQFYGYDPLHKFSVYSVEQKHDYTLDEFINIMGCQWESDWANRPEYKISWHDILDLAGMIPIVGELADGTNAVLYFMEGDIANGLKSSAGVVPFIGEGVVGLKVVKNSVKYFRQVKILKNSLQLASEAITEVKNYLVKKPDAVFEYVTESSCVGDNLKLKTINSAELDLSRSQLKTELKAKGMSEEAAESSMKCLEDGCFTGDTLVLTKEGLKRIDKISEGEFVFSKDVKTGGTAYKKVLQVYRKSSREFIHLGVIGEEIKTTSTHLFYMEGGYWKAAENIKPGDRILTSSGEVKQILSVKEGNFEEAQRIYNLNVEDYHTYFVGNQGLLVHNSCSEALTKLIREGSEQVLQKTAEELAEEAAEAATGQIHHLLSNKIMRALNNHPTLKGLFDRENPLFKFRAASAEAHKGYQQWHRTVDNDIVEWLTNNADATAQEFKNFINSVYNRLEIKIRIPGVNLQ